MNRVLFFLVINFAALTIGSLFTSKGVPSDWYINLNKAPWTPPGWVFGTVWFIIMICFAFYMSHLWSLVLNKKLLVLLFIFQWLLNVLWNPIFFHYHNVAFGLIVIATLTLLVGYLLIFFFPISKTKSLLILPYLLWLIIATSLNAYIFLKN